MLMCNKRSFSRTESCIFFLCIFIFVYLAASKANVLCEKSKNFDDKLEENVNLRIELNKLVSKTVNKVKRLYKDVKDEPSEAVKNIKYSNILEDSINMIATSNYNELMLLEVNLVGESHDNGSKKSYYILREWFILLCEKIFDPHGKYFQYIEDSEIYSIQFKSLNEITKEDEEFFKFVGKVVGLAIYNRVQIPAYFNELFYTKILGNKKDMKEVHIKNLQETSLEKFAPEKQINAFMKGFNYVIPKDLLKDMKFTEKELDALICGVAKIDIDDWKEHTYTTWCSDCSSIDKLDDLKKWFWEIIKKFNDKQKAVFLRYVTGVSRVPVCGFAEFAPMFTLSFEDFKGSPPYANISDRNISISIHYEEFSDLERALEELVNKEIESLHQFFNE